MEIMALLTDPAAWLALLTLIALEVILGVDNLIFIAILSTTAPALAAFARYNLIDSLNGKSVTEIQQLDWAKSWEATALTGKIRRGK